MTHDTDPLAGPHMIPGTFRAQRTSSFDLPEWMKAAIIAAAGVRPTEVCPHLSAGPQTIVRRVEFPEEALCLRCYVALAGYRACATCGVKVQAGSLDEWHTRDAEIPMPGTTLTMRYSASRCQRCWTSDKAPVSP
ncbi:hypothetical protein EF903_06950 [Streptomyces sp. WAC05292]|uniref:hypothetical protein n=1 Tax=Streptomyces sp. WAC05292 TaxID=2487418 RepID=UPI000F74A752|nr:hypothetical protein [Streptomyces sp. WAC05292]RSS94269.1 hypothetical protein EF903_06950 [Streptomyces sp. WAC05292]